MKTLKVLSLIIVIIMLCTALVGCGDDTSETSSNAQGGSQSGAPGTSNEPETEIKPVPQSEQMTYSSVPDKLTATKIGTLNKKSFSISLYNYIEYTENGKEGIMTLDGTIDTGAKYDYCSGTSYYGYFEVVTSLPDENSGIAGMNCMGLANINGDIIIPEKYASISMLNERFAYVCEVTEQTENKDEALVYSSDDLFSFSASDDDTFYKGNWYVYDITTGKMLNGVTGTQAYRVSAYGNYVEYYTDNQEKTTVNANGKTLPSGASLFENGYYRLAFDNNYAVYNSEDKQVFTYTNTDYSPTYMTDDYFIGTKRSNGTTAYVIMGLDGNVLSSEFNEMPSVYGKIIYCGNKIYSFSGKQLVDGTYTSVEVDKKFGCVYAISNRDNESVKFITEDGTVLFEGTDEKPYNIDSSYFSITYDSGDYEHSTYCFKTKGYTIKGTPTARWLARVNGVNFSDDLVYTVSGDKLIEGYSSYKYALLNGVTYVYAEKTDGTFDIYKIK